MNTTPKYIISISIPDCPHSAVIRIYGKDHDDPIDEVDFFREDDPLSPELAPDQFIVDHDKADHRIREYANAVYSNIYNL